MIRAATFVFVWASAELGERHGENSMIELARGEVLLKSGEAFGESREQIRVLVGLIAVRVESTQRHKIHTRRQTGRDQRRGVAQGARKIIRGISGLGFVAG